MKKNDESGITLIALVITIIVLLILAGVSLSLLLGDNGILQRSKDAKVETEKAEAKELAKFDIMEWVVEKTSKNEDHILDNRKVKEILTGKSYVKTAKDDSFITEKGEYEISYSELYTATTSETDSEATLPARTYIVGEEIEFGEEKFFVIGDDGNSVRILAKYCLNKEGTLQQNVSNNLTGRMFSKSYYWRDTFTNSPYNLQTNSEIELARNDNNGFVDQANGIENAVLTAIDYGKAKGVTGRLLKKDEAEDLKISLPDILCGSWDGDDKTVDANNLCFWLGEAQHITNVWIVAGYGGGTIYGTSKDNAYGVRPVLIVSKK